MVSTFAAPPHLPGQAENSRAAELPREQPVHLIFLSCNGKAGSKAEADQVRIKITSGISIPLNLASPLWWHLWPCLVHPSLPAALPKYDGPVLPFLLLALLLCGNNLSGPLAMVDFPSRSLGHRQPAPISSTEPGVGF